MTNALGTTVDRVLVSEATREMARPAGADARKQSTGGPADWALEVEENRRRLAEISGQMATMNARIQGRRLPVAEYRSLNEQKAKLVVEQQKLITRNRALKVLAQGAESSHGGSGDGPNKSVLMLRLIERVNACNDSIQELIAILRSRT